MRRRSTGLSFEKQGKFFTSDEAHHPAVGFEDQQNGKNEDPQDEVQQVVLDLVQEAT